MTPPPAPPSKAGEKSILTAIFLCGLGCTIALQAAASAYVAELGGLNSDEAPHYVNGLLIARYAAGGWGVSPMAFAAAFYRSFPKVSIGHWPPFFYVVEAGWMLAVSASRASVMVFSAVITTALATMLAGVTIRRHGWRAAAAAAAAFLLLPLVREMTAALLVDIAVALLDLGAAIALIAYVQRPAWRRAAWFGAVASAAIMTKGNGLALGLLPPFMILLTRRYDLLRRPDFWLPAALVALLCGPWYVATHALAQDGFFYQWGLAYSRMSLAANARFVLEGVGLPCIILAAAGSWGGRDQADRIFRSGLLALAAAVLVFQVLVPADLQSRYMIPLFGPLIVLAATGLADLAAKLPTRLRVPTVLAALAIGVGFVPGLTLITPKALVGMREAAQSVIDEGSAVQAVLIAAGAPGEGAFVVEMALREGSSAILIARGTKLLGSADFDGEHYFGRFNNPWQVAAAIQAAGLRMVVLDTSATSMRYLHNRLVQQAAMLAGWPLLSRTPHAGVDGDTLVYRVPNAASGAAGAACIWQPRSEAPSTAFGIAKPMSGCPE